MSTEIGTDLYGQAKSGGSGKDGITTEAKKAKVVLGYNKPLFDPRVIRHDRLAARASAPIPWEVTVDSQMPAHEAGDKIADLHTLFRLEGASPVVHEAFLEAVLFAHTLNSGSVLQPGRAQFSVGGNTNYLDFNRVVLHLGPDNRRFFRALANETREVNKRVLQAATDPDDIVANEKVAWLRNAAAKRGMSRHPELTHDSADACWNLTDAEQAALVASKAMVFSTTANMADRNRQRPGQSSSAATGSIYEDPTARVHALADFK